MSAAPVAALKGRGGGRGRKTVGGMPPYERSPLPLVLLLGSFFFMFFWLHAIRRKRRKGRKGRRKRRRVG